ncbi:MAG TPA: ABC transporter permease [Pseudothermotoga sp.]|nr:ABC transporter permease [Pseudothermotoga sp.]HOK83147.1 ABC transporter permease [Pseudothermotoga sp.]HPP69682.1 ABC transporter permease [Pseudothermotoga sp.]
MEHFTRYLIRRIISALVLVFLVMTLNFFIIHLAPGDPVTIMVGLENPSKQMIEALRKRYGLDQPLIAQYFKYIGNLLKGDFGYSYVYDQPSWKLIKQRIAPTLLLTITSSVVAFFIGAYLAIFVSRSHKVRDDTIVSIISYILYATPSFWLGLVMILVFSARLRWFPTSGMFNLRESYEGARKFLDLLHHMVLPATTLILVQMPVFYRVTRASIIQNYKQDYITTLTAIGVPRDRLFQKYVIRNAIIPSLTVFGITMGFSVTGATIIETVFAWPGMGRLLLDAIYRRDYQLILGIYFLMAVFISVAMIVTDLIIAFVDPRIRLT